MVISIAVPLIAATSITQKAGATGLSVNCTRYELMKGEVPPKIIWAKPMLTEIPDEGADPANPPPAEAGTTPDEIAAAAAACGAPGETEPGMEGMLKGPYVAETFPVTIDQDYVVVEVGGAARPSE